jgi:hypothetical protein
MVKTMAAVRKDMGDMIVLIPRQDQSGEMVHSEAFGMWQDRDDMDDVDAYVRTLRRGRKL